MAERIIVSDRTLASANKVTGASFMRQPLGNGNVAPYINTGVTNRFINIRKRRRVALNAAWNQVRLTYNNFTANQLAENSNYFDMVLRPQIKYNGTFYPVKFAGASEYVLSGGNKIDSDDVASLTLAPGDFYYECLRLTLPLIFKTKTAAFTVGQIVTGGTSGATGRIVRMVDNGTTGNLTLQSETGTFAANETITDPLGGSAAVDFTTTQNFIYSVSSQSAWLEGVKVGQDSTVDWSASEPVVYPVYTVTSLTGGNITTGGTSKVSGGSGYSGGAPSLLAWETQPNGYLAIKIIGYGNLSGGAVSSISVTSGTPPTGAVWTNPNLVLVGGSGFGTTTGVYCASKVTGIPTVAVKSLNIIGTSIDRGDSSADSTGDQYGNYGITERALLNRCGAVNMSTAGAKASYYTQYNTIYPKFFALYMGSTTHALLNQATNDAQAGDTKAILETNVNNIKNYVRLYGTKVTVGDVIPRTTGSLSPESSQAYEVGFAPGGVIDQYLADINNGVITVDWNVVRYRQYFQGVDPNKWRTDIGIETDDLIHPNVKIGIPQGAADATIKSYFNVLA